MSAGAPVALLWVGILLTPVMISAGQVLFKLTGGRIDGRGATGVAGILRTLADPYLLLAFAIYGSATILWVYVLRHMPLSQAYPFMALSFVLVPLASLVVFGETLGLRYWIGAGLIVAGMVVINA
ncbi:EamA family transporter [Roseibacterium sp. SDUM158017]|uniref:EamA family transporter n=1 Tax=Roseicyclus salinarum TaxID=3036773 RepID=UPI0024156772|nr:EamA family transporter [Roseibacterium sp. SDUM158017]MDG4650204.1 EamA family transporter [Roseibacterium sp. SDUM158017]